MEANLKLTVRSISFEDVNNGDNENTEDVKDTKYHSIHFVKMKYFEDFECAGDEVLVESSPPASPGMAARLAAPAQGDGTGGGASPSGVRELIVIPDLPNSIHLQHTMQQVSSTVVEANGDSSGHSSPTADDQHPYITVTMQESWSPDNSCTLIKVEEISDQESEGGNGVNYHVQYITEPQEIYTQTHQTHQTHNMDNLRSYPVYGVTSVGGASGAEGTSADTGWPGTAPSDYNGYGVVVAGSGAESAETEEGEAEAVSPPSTPGVPPPRMPPATVQWLLDHYETAEGVSLPRSTLYAHYLRHCCAHRLEPVNAASFGKLIRSVFLGLRTRRLGTRGNSKYHYYGIRAKPAHDADHDTAPPALHADNNADNDADNNDTDSQETRLVTKDRECVGGFGGNGGAHRQYLGSVSAPEPPELLISDLPDDIPPSALQALREHHREHGAEFLGAVSALDTGAVERARRSFWRRAGNGAGELCRRTLWRLTARADVARWLRAADLQLHQRAVELLLPDVLRPIPPQLTQAIRNFAKGLEGALAAGACGAPGRAVRAQGVAASALAAALRRYTSLNHLAQAARAVLTNQHQIHQMLADLNRVDFRVVREQAAWACACGSAATVHRLETDFKATLGSGATLEQWAGWLEGCVRSALAPHERRADYSARARRLLLDWSFYSSLVIRELTLRSAASFGSFHLIRLLYDEYVSYLIERRVAAHRRAPPIAVMQRALDDDDDLLEENPRPDGDDDDHDQDWDWEDDDDDEDDTVDCKKQKIECE